MKNCTNRNHTTVTELTVLRFRTANRKNCNWHKTAFPYLQVASTCYLMALPCWVATGIGGQLLMDFLCIQCHWCMGSRLLEQRGFVQPLSLQSSFLFIWMLPDAIVINCQQAMSSSLLFTVCFVQSWMRNLPLRHLDESSSGPPPLPDYHRP